MTRPIRDLDVPLHEVEQQLRDETAASDPAVGLNPAGRPRRHLPPARTPNHREPSGDAVMTGPEHYKRAESFLNQLRHAHASTMSRVTPERATAAMAEAQVHATLALAAATALNGHGTEEDGGSMPLEDLNEWREAAGVNLQMGRS